MYLTISCSYLVRTYPTLFFFFFHTSLLFLNPVLGSWHWRKPSAQSVRRSCQCSINYGAGCELAVKNDQQILLKENWHVHKHKTLSVVTSQHITWIFALVFQNSLGFQRSSGGFTDNWQPKTTHPPPLCMENTTSVFTEDVFALFFFLLHLDTLSWTGPHLASVHSVFVATVKLRLRVRVKVRVN